MNTYPSPLEMLYKWEQETPNKIYMRQPIKEVWHDWTWKETANQVRKMAAYLKSLNLPHGSRIGILSKNCAHWMFSDLAIMMAGHVSVPLYPNLSAEALKSILVLTVHSFASYPIIRLYCFLRLAGLCFVVLKIRFETFLQTFVKEDRKNR